MSNIYFILTSGRSGSTSLARILDTATNGICAVEPNPNFNQECRFAYDGFLSDAQKEQLVKDIIVPRVNDGLNKFEIYGEKNLTYASFILQLYKITGCKFVFLHRDGRDVVTSFIDWHNNMFGSIYRECKDIGKLSPRAFNAVSQLPVHLDTSDFSRLRPLVGSNVYDEWSEFSREEMCAWYWSEINRLYLEGLIGIPRDNWISISYSSITPKKIYDVFEFLELKPSADVSIGDMLGMKINSVKQRIGEDTDCSRWNNWNNLQKKAFDRLAAEMMCTLDYY